MLWEWLFWQARCRAVFPALERGKRREDTLATRFSAGPHRAGLTEGRHLTEKKGNAHILCFQTGSPRRGFGGKDIEFRTQIGRNVTCHKTFILSLGSATW